DYKINRIDTPGHGDFTIEGERPRRALAGAVAGFDGKGGGEAQPGTGWRQADRCGVRRISVSNQRDKIGADVGLRSSSIRQRLLAKPIAVQYPIGSGHDLEGIIDLEAMTAYYFDADEQGAVVTEKETPASLRETAELWRHELIEKASELDDALMERYL